MFSAGSLLSYACPWPSGDCMKSQGPFDIHTCSSWLAANKGMAQVQCNLVWSIMTVQSYTRYTNSSLRNVVHAEQIRIQIMTAASLICLWHAAHDVREIQDERRGLTRTWSSSQQLTAVLCLQNIYVYKL